MSLIGRLHLEAVPDPAPTPGREHLGHTVAELTDQVDVLLGALVEHHLRDLADQYGTTPTGEQRHVLADEARRRWLDDAATPHGVSDRVDRLRGVGRGTA